MRIHLHRVIKIIISKKRGEIVAVKSRINRGQVLGDMIKIRAGVLNISSLSIRLMEMGLLRTCPVRSYAKVGI